MLKAFFVSTVLAFMAVASPASAYDAPDGFRGLIWGQNYSEVKDQLQQYGTPDKGDLTHFTRKGDQLSIGSAGVDEIVYTFYKGRLFLVGVQFSGDENLRALRAATEERFGRFNRPNRFMDRYFWGSGHPVSSIIIDYSPVKRSGLMLFRSNEIDRQRDEDLKAAARAARKDF